MTNKLPEVLVVIRGIIKKKDNKILLALRHRKSRYMPNKYEFPGGKLTKNEDFNSSFEREMLEETGLLTKNKNHIFFIDSYIVPKLPNFDSYTGKPCILIIGLANVVGGEFRVSEKHSKCIWVKPQDIYKYPCTIETYKAVAALFPNLE